MPNDETKPARRDDLLTREIDGETVILDRAGRHVHHLSATATHIWNDCNGRRTVPEIAARLAARFRMAPADVCAHVLGAIANLEQLGLLTSGRARR